MRSKPPDNQIRTASDILALEQGCWWDEFYAEQVRQFAKSYLKPSKGKWANQPLDFLDWQYEEIIRPIYSWRKALRGSGKDVKRFSRASIWVPKKNGKSFVISALSLYETIATGEPGALVGCYASNQLQAKIVWGEAFNFVKKNHYLSTRLKPLKSKNEIIDEKTFSKLVAMSADDSGAHGYDYSCVCFDELHCVSTDLWDALIYAGLARDESFIVSISTAGDDRESLGYRQYMYAKGLLRKENPIIDVDVYPLVYELPEDERDKWDQPESWHKANPSLKAGLIKESDFEKDVIKVQNQPSELNNFLKLRLNFWAGKDGGWINPLHWSACSRDFKEEDFYGLPCWAGMDLSKVHDNSAVVYLFEKDEEFYIIPRFFCPIKAAAIKEKREGFPYRQVAADGQLILTDGDTIDYECIRQQVVSDAKKFDIVCLGYDYNGAEHLCNQELRLQHGINCEPIVPNYESICRATMFYERMLVAGALHHNDNRLMTWNVHNTVVAKNWNEDIIPSKKSSTSKIDGVSATVYAFRQWIIDNQQSPMIILAT